MSRPRRLPGAALVAPLVLVAGCSVQPADVGVVADCEPGNGHVNPLLVLMAQAVPSASRVPCIEVVPSSWRRGPVDVRDGRASFTFTSSSVEGPGDAVLSVVLTGGCGVDGATEVPSDEPGAKRFERVREVADGYEGERYYVFPGGCTTLDFSLPREGQVQQVGEASLAVGFVSRQALRDGVAERSDGRLQLDAEPAP